MSALDAAIAVAREHGLRVDEPRVLKDSHSLVVHLAPSPVVVKVDRKLEALRPGARLREVELTRWLVARGLPVLPLAPGLPAELRLRDGQTFTFWPFVEVQLAPDGAAAGRALREIDEALRNYDGELGGFWPFFETRALLAKLDLPPFVAELHSHIESELEFDPVPLHGDAHFRNCYFTGAGPLWADLEDACWAPPEWDAACLAAVVRVLGENGEYERALAELTIDDRGRLEQLVLLRAIVMVVWSTAMYGPSDSVLQRIEWLRRNAH